MLTGRAPLACSSHCVIYPARGLSALELILRKDAGSQVTGAVRFGIEP
ncbi:hypothetical protein [Streptomyces sp. NPDC048248]